MPKIDELLKEIKIPYKNIELYIEALTHNSYSHENQYDKNYQRLEFLGDAILDAIVSKRIFTTFQNANEGELSQLRARLVGTESLSKLANKFNLPKYIRVGKSKDILKSDKILEDVFESLIGAIFLDLGLDAAVRFIEPLLSNLSKKDIEGNKNPKTVLQEYLQLESREVIKYINEDQKGKFVSKVYHDDNFFGMGKGSSKKEAEVNAAKDALKRMGKNETN